MEFKKKEKRKSKTDLAKEMYLIPDAVDSFDLKNIRKKRELEEEKKNNKFKDEFKVEKSESKSENDIKEENEKLEKKNNNAKHEIDDDRKRLTIFGKSRGKHSY